MQTDGTAPEAREDSSANGAECRCAGPVVVGPSLRLTAIHAHCVRIEYDPDGRFTDEPTLFAIHRDARCAHPSAESSGDCTVIDTGVIRLSCRLDGERPGPGNVTATIRHAGCEIAWHPGMQNAGNLGGATRTLDSWYEARELPPGLLSRDGWFLLDIPTAPC